MFEKCTIKANGDPGPGDLTHNIYTEGGDYTFRFCRIINPVEGQNIHSRSLNLNIEYCLIENASSYMGDIMDYRLGGTSGKTFTQTLTMIGNLIVQKKQPANDAQVFVMYYDGKRANIIDMRINMYYNTFIGYGNNAALIHLTSSSIHHQSAYLYNNIFYGNHRPFRFDLSDNYHVDAKNNWWQSGYDYSLYSLFMSDSVFSDKPGFTNKSGGDYSLSEKSNARTHGDKTLGIKPEYELIIKGNQLTHKARLTVEDLGAFEYTIPAESDEKK